jgi:hypothetical protein
MLIRCALLFAVAHLIAGRDGLGMLDNDSPIWASDHYAVVTDLRLFIEKQ